jgi:hypothetical protein
MAEPMDTFNNAVDHFNKGAAANPDPTVAGPHWDAIESLLDINIIVKKVDDPTQVLTTKSTVIKYLRGMGGETPPDKPSFIAQPTSNVAYFGAKSAAISGVGTYIDNTYVAAGSAAATPNFAYCFILSQDSSGKWLILNVWGAILASDGSIKDTSATYTSAT